MKKRIIIGVVVGAVLTVTLLLTSCGPTNGSGTFVSFFSDPDVGVKFNLSAEASGSRYSHPVVPVGSDNVDGIYDFEHVFFQPAQGYFSFADNVTDNVTRIQGNFTGTFALNADPSVVFFPLSEAPAGTKISAFVGTCKAKSEKPGLNGSYYVLALFIDFGSNPEPDVVVLALYNADAPLFEKGWLQTDRLSKAVLGYEGEVVAGNIYIGQNSQGQNRNSQR